MKRHNVTRYILGLVVTLGICSTQIQALPFEPVAMESLPTEFTIRNLFSWACKGKALAQSLQGAQYIDSSDLGLQEQGAAFIHSAHNAFMSSRSWANYRSWIPPINWILSADLRNPWHMFLLLVGSGVTAYGTYLALKKLYAKLRPSPPIPAGQPVVQEGQQPGAPVNS